MTNTDKKAKSKTKKKTVAKKPKTVKKKKVPATDEETRESFKFNVSDASAQDIPTTGKVNLIELIQENRTDWLATRLPKEKALKYVTGEVVTRHGPGIGEVCVVVSKYRGDAIDANSPERAGEVYSLLFTPHYGEKNANLEKIDEGIDDADIKHALLALDESKALKFRNKFLVEREMRLELENYYAQKDYDFTYSATGIAAKAVNDVDLGERAVDDNTGGAAFNISNMVQWLNEHKLEVVIVIGIIIFIASMFIPR